jgi:predicted transcriptional regulator
MDYVKEAFQKVKQDIDLIKLNLDETNQKILNHSIELKRINEMLEELLQNKQEISPTDTSNNPTYQQISPTNQTYSKTENSPFRPPNNQFPVFSTGNGGVPADRQTNQQTDRQTQNDSSESVLETNSMERALKILNSLDNLKKEIRLKFKKLTDQEMTVFSAIYQIDEEFGFSDYKILSQRLNLTESSIRDYVGKLIKKGIPVDKIKINNKNIHLKISQNLKNIASLSTILSLREI